MLAPSESPIAVTVTETPIARLDPLAARHALARHFGEDQVFLLESLTGPPGHRPWAMVGFRPLVTLRLRHGVLDIDGVPGLVRHLGRLALASGGALAGEGASLIVPEASRGEAGGLWAVLRHIGQGFTVERPAGEGFHFGLAGYLGYDAIRYVEALPRLIEDGPDVPEVCFSIFQGLLRVDPEGARLLRADIAGVDRLDPAEIARLLADAAPLPDETPAVPTPRGIEDSIREPDYLAGVDRGLDHIRAGDAYQIQLGHELTIDSDAGADAVYRRLRRRNPAPYMVLASFGGVTLAGASPEVFVRVSAGTVLMRPLAGTIARGADPEADRAAAASLAADAKEVAEHVMLVDLCRNDIGRFCVADSLAVPVLLATEAYSHVHHLVSTVTGKAEPGADIWDIVAATFPAGTMTGAPKIRAIEIIEAIETRRRGLYAGAFGWVDFGGDADLALCIRTALHDGQCWSIRASAGIVADSQPLKEWRETLAKMAAGYWAITGREIF